MFKTILIAFDGSASSVPALHRAADLTTRYNAKLHLLGIVHTSNPMAFAERTADGVWTTEKDHILQSLDLAAVELSKQGLDAVVEVRLGEPDQEIVAYAKHIEADLVVLGHSEQGVFARWFEGSVCSELLNHLPCDLLISRRNA